MVNQYPCSMITGGKSNQNMTHVSLGIEWGGSTSGNKNIKYSSGRCPPSLSKQRDWCLIPLPENSFYSFRTERLIFCFDNLESLKLHLLPSFPHRNNISWSYKESLSVRPTRLLFFDGFGMLWRTTWPILALVWLKKSSIRYRMTDFAFLSLFKS